MVRDDHLGHREQRHASPVSSSGISPPTSVTANGTHTVHCSSQRIARAHRLQASGAVGRQSVMGDSSQAVVGIEMEA